MSKKRKLAQNAAPQKKARLNENATSTTTTTTTTVKELPGFFYDAEKKRYFRIMPGTNYMEPQQAVQKDVAPKIEESKNILQQRQATILPAPSALLFAHVQARQVIPMKKKTFWNNKLLSLRCNKNWETIATSAYALSNLHRTERDVIWGSCNNSIMFVLFTFYDSLLQRQTKIVGKQVQQNTIFTCNTHISCTTFCPKSQQFAYEIYE